MLCARCSPRCSTSPRSAPTTTSSPSAATASSRSRSPAGPGAGAWTLTPRDVFAHPTPAGLAAVATGARPPAAPPRRPSPAAAAARRRPAGAAAGGRGVPGRRRRTPGASARTAARSPAPPGCDLARLRGAPGSRRRPPRRPPPAAVDRGRPRACPGRCEVERPGRSTPPTSCGGWTWPGWARPPAGRWSGPRRRRSPTGSTSTAGAASAVLWFDAGPDGRGRAAGRRPPARGRRRVVARSCSTTWPPRWPARPVEPAAPTAHLAAGLGAAPSPTPAHDADTPRPSCPHWRADAGAPAPTLAAPTRPPAGRAGSARTATAGGATTVVLGDADARRRARPAAGGGAGHDRGGRARRAPRRRSPARPAARSSSTSATAGRRPARRPRPGRHWSARWRPPTRCGSTPPATPGLGRAEAGEGAAPRRRPTTARLRPAAPRSAPAVAGLLPARTTSAGRVHTTTAGADRRAPGRRRGRPPRPTPDALGARSGRRRAALSAPQPAGRSTPAPRAAPAAGRHRRRRRRGAARFAATGVARRRPGRDRRRAGPARSPTSAPRPAPAPSSRAAAGSRRPTSTASAARPRPGRHRAGRGRRSTGRVDGHLAAVAAAGGPVLPRHLRRRRPRRLHGHRPLRPRPAPSTSTGCARRAADAAARATRRCGPAFIGDGLPQPVQAVVDVDARAARRRRPDRPRPATSRRAALDDAAGRRARRAGSTCSRPPLCRHRRCGSARSAAGSWSSRHLLLWDGWSGQLVFAELFAPLRAAAPRPAWPPPGARTATTWPGSAARTTATARGRLARARSPASTSRRWWPRRPAPPTPVLPDARVAELPDGAQRPASRAWPAATGLTLNTRAQRRLGLVLGRPGRPRRRRVRPDRRRPPAEVPDVERHHRPVPQHRARPGRASTPASRRSTCCAASRPTAPRCCPRAPRPRRRSSGRPGTASCSTPCTCCRTSTARATSATTSTAFLAAHDVEGFGTTDATHYPLTLVVRPGDRLRVLLAYRPDLVDDDLADGRARPLRAGARRSSPPTRPRPVGALDLVGPAERDGPGGRVVGRRPRPAGRHHRRAARGAGRPHARRGRAGRSAADVADLRRARRPGQPAGPAAAGPRRRARSGSWPWPCPGRSTWWPRCSRCCAPAPPTCRWTSTCPPTGWRSCSTTPARCACSPPPRRRPAARPAGERRRRRARRPGDRGRARRGLDGGPLTDAERAAVRPGRRRPPGPPGVRHLHLGLDRASPRAWSPRTGA